MSDMLKRFVEEELGEQIKQNYPHMQYPPGLYARVVTVKEKSEGLYVTTLKILDKNKRNVYNENRKRQDLKRLRRSIRVK